MNRPTRLAGVALLAAGCVAGFAACGDDDDEGGGDSIAAACKADSDLNAGVERFFQSTPALQGDGPPPKSATPQIRANYDRLVAGPIARLQREAPEEIKDDVNSAVADFSRVRNGDFSKVEAPAFEQKTGRIDAYFFDNCEGQKSEVEGLDFAFDGVEKTYETGPTRFKLDNTGKEVHVLVVVRRKPGVRESFDQILALPEERARAKVDEVGGTDDAEPGKQSYGSFNLTPGDYIAICPIPVGSTPGKEGKGPPHFVRGMKTEFSVE